MVHFWFSFFNFSLRTDALLNRHTLPCIYNECAKSSLTSNSNSTLPLYSAHGVTHQKDDYMQITYVGIIARNLIGHRLGEHARCRPEIGIIGSDNKICPPYLSLFVWVPLLIVQRLSFFKRSCVHPYDFFLKLRLHQSNIQHIFWWCCLMQ